MCGHSHGLCHTLFAYVYAYVCVSVCAHLCLLDRLKFKAAVYAGDAGDKDTKTPQISIRPSSVGQVIYLVIDMCGNSLSPSATL